MKGKTTEEYLSELAVMERTSFYCEFVQGWVPKSRDYCRYVCSEKNNACEAGYS